MQLIDSDLERISNATEEIAREAGRFLLKQVNHLSSEDIETKGKHDYVSYVDRQTEAFLVKELEKQLPGAGFLAEEEHRSEGINDLKWIIDPLDGTTNYIHRLPVYSISIALARGQNILLGIVHEVNNNECFSTFANSPSTLNGEEIKCSETEDIEESLMATGFPYSDYRRLDDYLSLLTRLIRTGRGIRRFGSAAVDLAYVACGRFDVFFEYGLKPWDVAAGSLLVKNSGGRISDFRGGSHFLFGQEILATNDMLHNILLEYTNQAFGKKTAFN